MDSFIGFTCLKQNLLRCNVKNDNNNILKKIKEMVIVSEAPLLKTTDFFLGMQEYGKLNSNFPNADCNLTSKTYFTKTDTYSYFFADLNIYPMVNTTFIINLKVIKMYTCVKEIPFYDRRVHLKPPDTT